MVGRKWAAMLVLGVVLGSNTLVAEEPKLRGWSFENCLLFETQARVWLREPMVYLGMVGVIMRPDYCLSKTLAQKYAPLVSRTLDGRQPGATKFYTFDMPRLREGADKFVLVRLETKMRPLEVDTSATNGSTGEPVATRYEIVSARLKAAECVQKEWIENWKKLDEALDEVVSRTLAAPSERKRKALAAAVEKGSQALNNMEKLKVSDQFRALVKQIEPEARLVGTFKERITEQWYEWLEKCCTRLRTQPKTPLPSRCKKLEVLKLLADSESAPEFMSKLRESCPANGLESELLWWSKLRRRLCAWEVEELTDDHFSEVRDKVKAWLAEVRKDERELAAQEKTESLEQWGVVLRPARVDSFADKLILNGAVVEKVLAEQPQVGLRPGDIVVDYEHIYEVVMGWRNFGHRMRQLANKARQRGQLRVLRGNEIVTIHVKGK